MRWVSVAVCALLATTTARDAGAQEGQRVLVGDRVRVEGDGGRRTVGEVSLLSETALQVRLEPDGSTSTFDLGGLRSVQVHRGQRRFILEGILGGAVLGGAGAWAVGSLGEDACPYAECADEKPPILQGALLGAVLGGLAGLIPRQRWESIPLYCIPGGCAARIIVR